MKKALFLDRDGVINIDHGYVFKMEDFVFTKGIFDLLRLFTQHNYLLFIVTNQSGIGRGYYSEKDFQNVTESMLEMLHNEGINITKVYHCPHAPEAKCHCRKPAIGMIADMAKKHAIDFSNSWMIGDKQSDIDFAKNAGIAHRIAIGDENIEHCDYFFTSIASCSEFLEENPDIIKA